MLSTKTLSAWSSTIHGKQFVIRAAFLRHINDEPRFGNEPTFSMPLTTRDILASANKE